MCVYIAHAATIILQHLNPHKFFFSHPIEQIFALDVSKCRGFFCIQFHRHPSGALIFFLTRTVIQMSSFLMVSFMIRGEKRIPLGSGRGLTLSQKIILYYILCVWFYGLRIHTHTYNIYVSHNIYNIAE